MQELLQKIKNLFSSRWATIAIIAIAISSRFLQLVFFFNMRVDRSYQLLATQNFVYGDGITTAAVLPADLSTIIHTPLIKWPPGYSLLLAPLYSITGNDYLLSSLLLDIVFAIILLFVSRKILQLLDTPLFLVNIYTIISSLFIYYFYFITSSDAIASTLFIIALYCTLSFLKNKIALPKAVLLMSLFLFAAAFMKYLFMPAVFTVPFFLIWKGYRSKNKPVLRAGIVVALLLTIGLATTLLYQKSISGASTYVSNAPRGFFAENLLSAYPLIPAAIIKPETIGLLFNSPATDRLLSIVFKALYFLFLVISIICLARHLKKTKWKSLTLRSDFFYITIGICIATIVLLATISLQIAKGEDTPGNWWTFIQEPRYYGLPNVLIHLSIFALYPIYKLSGSKWVRLVFFFLLLSLLPELFRGTVFTIKRVFHFGKEEYSWQGDLKIQQYVDSIITKEKQRTLTNDVILAGSSYYFNNRISLYSHIPILETNSIANESVVLQTKKPVLLVSVIHDNDSGFVKKITTIEKPALAGHYYDFSIFITRILPVITK
ncbi:hypothetical protein CAP36_13525 [Chitinophagaceae bacterium IBVUCB2]|nr:hypothetical protein CAP36_13525 [Chitinophagaceae bacterium IBVUCB2]